MSLWKDLKEAQHRCGRNRLAMLLEALSLWPFGISLQDYLDQQLFLPRPGYAKRDFIGERAGGWLDYHLTPRSDWALVDDKLTCQARLHPALASLRVVVLQKPEQPKLFRCLLRLPTGKNMVDNFSNGVTGNLLASVDPASGTIEKVATGRGMQWRWLEEHPDSGQRLTDRPDGSRLGRSLPFGSAGLATLSQAAPATLGYRPDRPAGPGFASAQTLVCPLLSRLLTNIRLQASNMCSLPVLRRLAKGSG